MSNSLKLSPKSPGEQGKRIPKILTLDTPLERRGFLKGIFAGVVGGLVIGGGQFVKDALVDTPRRDLAVEALRSAKNCRPGMLTLRPGVNLHYFPDGEVIEGKVVTRNGNKVGEVEMGETIIITSPLITRDKAGRVWMGFTMQAEKDEKSNAPWPKPSEEMRWINFSMLDGQVDEVGIPYIQWEEYTDRNTGKPLPDTRVAYDVDGYPFALGNSALDNEPVAHGIVYDHPVLTTRG